MRVVPFLLLPACGPLALDDTAGRDADTDTPTETGERTGCALTEGAWALVVGGVDYPCMGGLETANGAEASVTCTDPEYGLARLAWQDGEQTVTVTCTATAGDEALRCAYGGIDLEAAFEDDGRAFSGSWTGRACSGTWSGSRAR
jgi:hypothetical protein